MAVRRENCRHWTGRLADESPRPTSPFNHAGRCERSKSASRRRRPDHPAVRDWIIVGAHGRLTDVDRAR
jgi:hypothetical protein